MDGAYTDWMPAVWAHCWQVTLLIVAVWIINRLTARNRPHLASVLWLVVLIKCVTPPLWSSPSSIFSWLQSRQSITAPDESANVPKLGTTDSRASIHDDIVVQVIHPEKSSGRANSARPPVKTSSRLERCLQWISSLGQWSSWTGLAVAGWLIGGLCFSTCTLLRWILCWRRLCRAGEIEAPQVVALTDKLRHQLGLRRAVRVVVSRSPVGPAVVGIWRPTVILPTVIVEAKTLDELEPLLAHELVHIRRGDLWVGLLQLLAQGVWWFHPLVRLTNRWLTRDAERCCDEEVIARLGCDPGRYARTLIDVLELKRILQTVPAVPGVRPVDVTSQRLERIMKLGQGCHKRTPRWCWAIMVLAAAATLPGAAFIAAGDEQATVPPVSPPSLPATQKVKGKYGPDAVESSKQPSDKVERETRVYSVEDILQRMQADTGFDKAEARRMLSHLVKQAAARAVRQSKLRSSRPYHTVEWQSDDAEELEVRHFEKTDALIIRCTPQIHERIQDGLAAMRADGFQEVSIETQIICGPAANAATIPFDWKVLDLGTPSAPQVNESDEFPDRHVEPANALEKDHILGRVESVVEKRHPTMLALPDVQLVRAIVEQAQSHRRTNIMWAPKITLYNGQTATVQDLIKRHFISGFERKEGQDIPTVQICEEGWTMHCRPKLQGEGDAVQLDLNVTLREIVGVETTVLSHPTVRRVQVPEQATTRVRADVLMRLNQTLVIGGLTNLARDQKTREPLLILVRLRKLGPTTSPKTDPEIALKADPQPIQQVSGAKEAYTSKEILRAEGEADATEKHKRIQQEFAELVDQFNGLMKDQRFEDAALIAKKALKLDPANPTAEIMRWKAEFATSQDLRGKQGPEERDGTAINKAAVAPASVPNAADEEAPPALSTKVYAVADLVIPVDSDVPVRFGGEAADTASPVKPTESPAANFKPLIEQLEKTIDPNSWDATGGPASVKAFESTLSLVVRQTETNHQQVATVLSRLRALQDVQTSLTIEHLQIAVPKLEEWASSQRQTYVNDIVTAIQSKQPVMAISNKAEQLLRTAEGITLTQGAKVTVFSGQPVELVPPMLGSGRLPRVRSVHALPIVSPDIQRIRLNVSANQNGSEQSLGQTQFVTVPNGSSLLIDLTEEGWTSQVEGVPILQDIPYLSRLFQKPKTERKSRERYFYLITPRVLIAPELEDAHTKATTSNE